jgi:hypothetical protein
MSLPASSSRQFLALWAPLLRLSQDRHSEGAGLIGAVIGALIVLVIWGMVAPPDRIGAKSFNLKGTDLKIQRFCH